MRTFAVSLSNPSVTHNTLASQPRPRAIAVGLNDGRLFLPVLPSQMFLWSTCRIALLVFNDDHATALLSTGGKRALIGTTYGYPARPAANRGSGTAMFRALDILRH